MKRYNNAVVASCPIFVVALFFGINVFAEDARKGDAGKESQRLVVDMNNIPRLVGDLESASECAKYINNGNDKMGTDAVWDRIICVLGDYDPISDGRQTKKWMIDFSQLAERYPPSDAASFLELKSRIISLRHSPDIHSILDVYLDKDEKRLNMPRSLTSLFAVCDRIKSDMPKKIQIIQSSNPKLARQMWRSLFYISLISSSSGFDEIGYIAHNPKEKMSKDNIFGRQIKNILGSEKSLSRSISSSYEKYNASRVNTWCNFGAVLDKNGRPEKVNATSGAVNIKYINPLRAAINSSDKDQVEVYLHAMNIRLQQDAQVMSSCRDVYTYSRWLDYASVARIVAKKWKLQKCLDETEGVIKKSRDSWDPDIHLYRMVDEVLSFNKDVGSVPSDYLGMGFMTPEGLVFSMNPFDGSLVRNGEKPTSPANWKTLLESSLRVKN